MSRLAASGSLRFPARLASVSVLFGLAALTACGGGGDAPPPPAPPAPNQAPSATNATLTTNEDSPSAATTPSVTDANAGDSHTYAVVTQPAHGTASLVGNQLVYTPGADFNGTDSFTYSATDSGGLSVVGTASVTVTAVNDALTAAGGDRPVHATTPGSLKPWVEDIDLGDTHGHTLATGPASGTVAFAAGRWTYTPGAGVTNATDSFTFQATDGGGASVTGTSRVRIYDDTALPLCRRAGTVNGDGTLGVRAQVFNCAFYDRRTTRTNGATPVTMDYLVNRPTSDTSIKGVVVLIGGGEFNMSITGNTTTGMPATSGGNFIVRTAQVIADAGYVTVALTRPSDVNPVFPTDVFAVTDAYRVSAKHAVDITSILQRVNTERLPVFLAGTSRGAMSAVANNLIASGIALSSPVTGDAGVAGRLYIGHATTPNLQPSWVQRPAHVMWHQSDACIISTPANSQAVRDGLVTAGVTTASSVATGGVVVTSPLDLCGAFHHHGYLGIEPTAAGYLTAWLDARVAALGTNRNPEVSFRSLTATAGVARQIDLGALARDADNDPLTYAVSHPATVLGGSVAVTGSTATYTPPAGVTTGSDQFVYVVTDNRGGVSAAVITVQIGS